MDDSATDGIYRTAWKDGKLDGHGEPATFDFATEWAKSSVGLGENETRWVEEWRCNVWTRVE